MKQEPTETVRRPWQESPGFNPGSGSQKDAFFEGSKSFYTQAVDDALAEIERLCSRHPYFLDHHSAGGWSVVMSQSTPNSEGPHSFKITRP